MAEQFQKEFNVVSAAHYGKSSSPHESAHFETQRKFFV
jgi:hypothetical protein